MKTSTKILIGVALLIAVVWGVKMIGGSDNDNNNDNNHDIFTEVDSVEYRVMNDEAVVMGINRASMVVEEVHIRSEIEYNGRMLKVTSINESAFEDCGEIKAVYIPNSVTEIGKRAFDGCSNLTEMHLRHKKTLPDIDESEIDTSKVTLYVPTGCGKKYRKDPVFGRFKNIVEE